MTHKVTQLIQTCLACPSQWQGMTDEGKHLYIRYRYGVLELGIADNLEDAVWATVRTDSGESHKWKLGDGWQGIMDTSDMMQRVSEVLDFSGNINVGIGE